ncbi:MAG TPA: 50S ribosomal protein L4 [Armatimonadota bacterium]|nr:50S ribosomal protein L4 [Armatimonadota bacterium]HOS44162.1 50S ribosomal protein L4 [Armatimonadota bacterium]
MVTIPLYTPAGETAGSLDLADEVFGVAPNPALVHQAVVATLANRRQGTHDTKTRGEVHHSTRKVYRQKGTGRARQGMRSAPHWKGGGIAFGPHPRDYDQGLPKKMRRKALLSALSARVADAHVVVVESFGLAAPKTREAVKLLGALGLAGVRRLLVVLDDAGDEAILAFRNLPNVQLTTAQMLCTYDVLCAERLLFTRGSLERFQELKQQPVGPRRLPITAEGGAA